MLWMLGVFWVLGMVGHVTIPYRPNIPTVAIRYLEWVAGEGFKEGKSR
jgi:hypothetical protein